MTQRHHPRLSHVGRKFTANGQVLPFAGNSIICHLPQQGPNSAPFSVLLDFFRHAPWTSFGSKIVLLPPSSYHVTILDGVCDVHRNGGRWPKGIAHDTAMEACNDLVAQRLGAASLPRVPIIRMGVGERIAEDLGKTLRMPLAPKTGADAERIEDLRTALAVAMGIPSPPSGAYEFHITLGYLLDDLAEEERRAAVELLTGLRDRLDALPEPIILGCPEFCVFQDMFAFERRFFIGES